MIAYEPLELIVTPEITYIRFDQFGENRRIYTDGRSWPDRITPSFDGYSIGRWVDRDASGRYGALEVETRGFKGPRTIDQTGMPLHPDNQTILKERFYLDAAYRQRLYAAVDGHTRLQSLEGADLAGDQLQLREPLRVSQEGELFRQRRRSSDADPQGPAGAGSAEFQVASDLCEQAIVRSSPRKRGPGSLCKMRRSTRRYFARGTRFPLARE
jgi:hypothetical protein